MRFALNIKELNRNQQLVFPLLKPLMRQWLWILKNGPMIKEIQFFDMIDHVTIYSVSWVRIFDHPNKILVDNDGEFDNTEFQALCEDVNIRICTTSAERPWSNGLIERHNAVFGLTVTKTMEDIKCDLQLAVSWAASAKNSFEKCSWLLSKPTLWEKPEFPRRMR